MTPLPEPLVYVPPLVGSRGLQRRSSLIPGDPVGCWAVAGAARRGWNLSYLCHVMEGRLTGEEKNNVFTSLNLASPPPTYLPSLYIVPSVIVASLCCVRVRSMDAHEGQSAPVKKYNSMDG